MATRRSPQLTETEKHQYSSNESCSCSAMETIKGSHRYMVKGFSLFKGMGAGKFISSDVFTVGGYDWEISFYPDGEKIEDKSTHVSAFLALVSKEAKNVPAVFSFSLMDQTGDDHFTLGSNAPHKFDSNREKVWGYNKFYEKSKLETSKYIREDCLVIRCNMGVVKESKEIPKEFSISIPPSNFEKCFKGFLESGNASDIIFKIGKQTIKAHKLILAARSPVFHAHFYGPMGKPSLDEIVVEDIPAPVFEALLDFIYTDSLPSFENLESSPCSSTTLEQHLLIAADIYGLDRLKLLCEDKLSKKLTTESVGSTFELAEQHNCSHLRSACLNFIVFHKNLGDVLKSEGFQKLKKSPDFLMEVLRTVAADWF